MARWQRHIKLQPEWGKAQDGELSTAELAGTVARKLRSVPSLDIEPVDDERDEILEQFEDLATDPECDVADFDCVMEQFYNWGDTSLDDKFAGKKVCWIDTLSQ